MAEPEILLRTEKLSKRFGGLLAVRDVALEVATGGIHAVIGPNGAGRSTLLDMLSGDVKPSSGTIRFGSREIAGWSAHQVARPGVGRSYQRTNIFSRRRRAGRRRCGSFGRLPPIADCARTPRRRCGWSGSRSAQPMPLAP